MVDAPQTIGLVGIPFGWRLWSSDIDGSEMYGVVRYVLHSDHATLEAENTRLREDVETLKGQLVAAWNAFGPSAFRNKKPPFDIDDLDHLPSSAHGGLDEQIHSLEDQVEAAEALNAVLEKALQPFAAYLDTAAWDLNNNGDPLPDDHGMGWVYLTIGNFREARAALTPAKENDHAE